MVDGVARIGLLRKGKLRYCWWSKLQAALFLLMMMIEDGSSSSSKKVAVVGTIKLINGINACLARGGMSK